LWKGNQMDRVSIGFAAYGSTSPKIWGQWMMLAASLHEAGIHLEHVLVGSQMATDNNRNIVAHEFLKSDTEWLFWLDTDVVPPWQALKKLLDLKKTIATGLYYLKDEATEPTIYTRQVTGRYAVMQAWEPGEIMEVDSAGHGCLLVHRKVYEDIQAKFALLQRPDGAMFLYPRDQIVGKIDGNARHKTDGKVIDGVLRTRMYAELHQKTNEPFPFYSLERGRTEDMLFFECAQYAGHRIWCDTAIECRHGGWKFWDGRDYRGRLPGLFVVGSRHVGYFNSGREPSRWGLAPA
jgi:hypothetical protein